MPQQVEHAVPTTLTSISSQLASRKLRVAGWYVSNPPEHINRADCWNLFRLLHDDMASSTIMIHDGEDALLVDISLCLSGSRKALWLQESKTIVMALGYLELSRVRLSLSPPSTKLVD